MEGRLAFMIPLLIIKEDVQLMVETGLDAYRFSISWSRLIPNGRGPINPKGLRYYNNLINELIIHGIEPHVTLVHSDVPQILEDEYGSFLDPRIIDDFTAYADVCFREFGDRVRYWTTFNEPNIYVFGGYDAKQHGLVGINFLSYHYGPLTNTIEDIDAARRCYDFMIGWFMHPLTYGDYPQIMKETAGNKIPVFTKNQSNIVKGSIDFVGLNYYTIIYTKANSNSLATESRDFFQDMAVEWTFYCVVFGNEPWGLERVLEYFKEVYGNPIIFIHENGQASNYSTSIDDPFRVKYLHDHIWSLLKAIRNGSNTKGHFVWSFLDLYELLFGFDFTFGLYYVNFSDPNLSRHPKMSQKWYSAFLKGKNVTMDVEDIEEQHPTFDIRFSDSVRDDEVLRRHPKLLQHMSS
ncbi:Cyanidin 3-O-glucoside 5-O-glucosyltransferase [Bienertia sinuspersici]